MAVNPIVYHQPHVAQPLRGWSTGLFGCFEDINSCCYGFWCCPCLACSTTGEFGENTCVPLVDLLGSGLMAILGIPVCVPPASLALRVAIRHKYHIQGSICEDIASSCFCVTCSWCQMAREIKNIKTAPATITAQPMAYSFQPQPQATNTTTTTTSQVFTKNEHNGMSESLSTSMAGQAYPPGPSPMAGQAYPPGPSPMAGQAYPPGPSPMAGQAYPPGPYPMPGQSYAPGPYPMAGQTNPPGLYPMPGKS